MAAVKELVVPVRRLSLFNPHTWEKSTVIYYQKGDYCREGLNKINHIMRDHRTGEIVPIDPKLLDLLFAISLRLNDPSSIHVISGYRSQTTNSMLRRKRRGVAANSFHIKGKAADIRFWHYPTQRIRQAAVSLRSGGVGYYPRSDFVHIDTGPPRVW